MSKSSENGANFQCAIEAWHVSVAAGESSPSFVVVIQPKKNILTQSHRRKISFSSFMRERKLSFEKSFHVIFELLIGDAAHSYDRKFQSF